MPLLRSAVLGIVLLPLVVHAAPWTTSRIHGTPEPAKPFIAEQVYAAVPFDGALDMVPVPGEKQWVIVESSGKIWSLPMDLAATKAEIALDLKALHSAVDHAYGVVFHPRFKDNKQVFITYTNGDKKDDGSRLSRFVVAQTSPLLIDPKSEEILITWRSGGHNGAALAFGSDGMLYVTTGDSEVPAPPDPLKTGQDIRDLLSSVLRLDVDHKDEGKNYSIPKDNPFLSTAGARGEIWCYGLRNPWKLSLDKPTGNLWCGDVGWELWENVYLIKRGENYGWCATEGNNVLFPELKGPTPITPPIATHSHSEAASITGGFVYHGKAFPELEGAYVYGDYETGKIWALWHADGKVTRQQEIATTPLKIVTFGQDHDGELFFIHWNKQGTIHRLVRNPAASQPSSFPRKLSETGLFANTVRQSPAEGVLPFAVRAPMWADGAEAVRYVALPQGQVETKLWTTNKGKIDSKVTWPKDTVLAKTLTMPLRQGAPESAIKVETQVLHFDGYAWNAYSYRWNDQGTDAELVPAGGDERVLELQGSQFPEGTHRYKYRFHSRAECLRCHTSWSGYALGFQPPQIVDGAPLVAAGVITEDYLKRSSARLVDPYQPKENLDQRARSWLHANCAHCHRENGGGAVPMVLNAELDLMETRAVREKPTRGDFGIAQAGLLSPEAPWQSVVIHRAATLGANRMPAVGAQMVDVRGVLLLERWLMSLNSSKDEKGAGVTFPLTAMQTALSPTGWVEKDSDWLAVRGRNPRMLDQLIADIPGAAFVAYAIDTAVITGGERTRAIKLGAASGNPHIRGLFERFLADSERQETLGATASSEKILALKGNAARGSALLSPLGKAAACLACHVAQGAGRDIGPNLSQVGSRLQPEQIVESLLAPSKTLSEGYQAVTAKLKNGTTQTGFVIKRDGDVLKFRTVTGENLDLPADQVYSELPIATSLMPEGLMQAFTAQEAADLVAYLASLKS